MDNSEVSYFLQQSWCGLESSLGMLYLEISDKCEVKMAQIRVLWLSFFFFNIQEILKSRLQSADLAGYVNALQMNGDRNLCFPSLSFITSFLVAFSAPVLAEAQG